MESALGSIQSIPVQLGILQHCRSHFSYSYQKNVTLNFVTAIQSRKKKIKIPKAIIQKVFFYLASQLRFDLSGLLLKIVTNEKLKQLSPICIRKNSPWCMKLNSIAFLLLMQLLSARGRQEKICERKYNVYKLDWHKCSSHFLPAA